MTTQAKIPALGLTIEAHSKNHDMLIDKRNVLVGEVYRQQDGSWKWIRWGPTGDEFGTAPDQSTTYEQILATFQDSPESSIDLKKKPVSIEP